MKRTRTVCPFCGCGCSFYLLSEGDRVAGIEPSPSNPINKGMLCVKGWNAHEFIHSSGKADHAADAEARRACRKHLGRGIEVCCGQIDWISRKKFGPRALGFLSSAKVTNEENYLFMKMARAVFRTNNVDHCARL